MKRYKLDEISGKRIVSGIVNRINDFPHLASWYMQPIAFENRLRLEKYKGIHQGKRCFIVANGPSLAKINLNYLANEISFGLNRIYLNFKDSPFRPSYYVAVNELVLNQFHQDISELDMPRFLNWNKRSFFDTKDPELVFLKSKHVLKDRFEKDLTHPFVFGGTVTFVTLQLAFYMGFKTVIIVGLDHNYVEKGTPNATAKREENKDSSHFHPEYFPKGIKWQLPDLLRSEVDYELARAAFEEAGREVYDATDGGNCTVFLKRTFKSFFE